MSKKLILGIDIGTSSVRAALYDKRGKLPETFVQHERSLTKTAGGGSEIDAEAAFRQVVRAIDDLLIKSAGIHGEIGYVASCAFWHTLVGVDAHGKPTTKVLGWGDTRSRKYTEVLRKRFDEGKTHNRTGARFHSSFWPAKLLWLRKEFPELFAKTTNWLSFSDFIALKLFGRPVTSVSMASGTGVLDIRRCDWDAELLRFLKIKPGSLPELVANDDETFRLRSVFAKRWPRLADANWSPSIADGAANNIGAGCIEKSSLALMVGTSGALRVVYEGEPPKQIPGGLWCYRVDRERVILGGALSDGGGLISWLRHQLNLDHRAEEMIVRRPPAGHGITVLPFFGGERSTGYHENASGAILGMTSSTDSIDILQAALESVAYRFAEILDQLNEVVTVKSIVATGGALHASSVWTQIVADVLGRDLTISNISEESMQGAVLLALDCIGVIKYMRPNVRTVHFDKERHRAYRRARERHRSLYETLIK